MDDNLPAVLTVDEVALYLRIPRGSVYKLAQRGWIPCQKVGGGIGGAGPSDRRPEDAAPQLLVGYRQLDTEIVPRSQRLTSMRCGRLALYTASAPRTIALNGYKRYNVAAFLSGRQS